MKAGLKKIRAFFSGWKSALLQAVLIVVIYISVRAYQQQDILTGVAPPIQGQLLTGTEINWPGYQDKPLLIHFWATWCPVCRLEEDSIQSISQDYNVISVASWSDDTAEYMKKKGLSFPTRDDLKGEWAAKYGIKAVPATFIVNRQGNIEFIEVGYSSELGLRLRLWWLEL